MEATAGPAFHRSQSHGYINGGCAIGVSSGVVRKKTIEQFKELIDETAEERASVLKQVAKGDWRAAETDPVRRADFQIRELKLAADAARRISSRESKQGDTLDLQSVAFLNEGSDVRRCIARVEVDIDGVTDSGTGFLISPRLFLTNQHVILDRAHANAATITFDYELDRNNARRVPTVLRLDPEAFDLYSDELDLDFALIALGEKISGPGDPSEFGYSPLSKSRDRHQKGMNANIIQHPGGALKKVAVRNNIVTNRTAKYLLYRTDTLKGSSGAPVFNDDWDVVALHHYGAPSGRVDEDGDEIPEEINQGVRISQIYERLEDELPDLLSPRMELLQEALNLFQDNRQPSPTVERRRINGIESAVISRQNEVKEEHNMSYRNQPRSIVDEGDATFTIPLQVTVRIPGAAIADGYSGRARTMPSADTTTSRLPILSSREGKRLDRDYSNRNGFDEAFIDGFDASLADILQPVKRRIQPLKESQRNHKSGILKYQNFSVVMDSETRFALVTATNIDDATYRAIDRETGEPRREGESWYIERRIDRGAFIDQDFYSGWSHIFDRGHLTRRNDPTWGSVKEAKRANADTFHFTNCTPQQWRFNQSTEIWQGIERYVLEKGVSDNTVDTRVSVLQGPLFTDGVDENSAVFADDVMIPIAFWKLVFWRKRRTKKVVALIASQESMLNEERGGRLSRPDSNASVDVEEFRVPVSELEDRTGMDFSEFKRFDTIRQSEAPDVAENMRRKRLRSLEDVVL